MKRMRLLTMLLASIVSVSTVSAQSAKLEVGMVAPDFSAQDQNGKTVSLKDFREKAAVALCFYPKALTGG